MSKFNDLLHLRFRSKEPQQSKMTALVERASSGELSSFSGIFRVTELNANEKSAIESILQEFRTSESYDIAEDLQAIMAISSEVKAISNQAIILHGERIQKAQEILKSYRDGAFTAWLFATYGNRQTPYNFLQYYEFYTAMPQSLHSKIDQMPRQAIYSLASRAGSSEKKESVIKSYNGQTKQELLRLIRLEFPLGEEDKRQPNLAAHAIQHMKRAREMLRNALCVPSAAEKQMLQKLAAELQALVERH